MTPAGMRPPIAQSAPRQCAQRGTYRRRRDHSALRGVLRPAPRVLHAAARLANGSGGRRPADLPLRVPGPPARRRAGGRVGMAPCDRRQRLPLAAPHEVATRAACERLRSRPSIAAEAPADGDQRGLCRDLRETLRALPATQRRALVLREWHGLPSHEVAAALGMSTSATYALLTRARQSFARAFEAAREAVPGIQLAALLPELRAQLKALFGAASAKTATVATVAAVGVGGVAVERSLDADARGRANAPTSSCRRARPSPSPSRPARPRPRRAQVASRSWRRLDPRPRVGPAVAKRPE